MSETVATQRPTSFHMKLHVDPADDSEHDTPLTTKSWRVQLLRLLQRAPLPIPVLCDEPRAFPHFGNRSRISDSWTSDSTHCTDVSDSGSGSQQQHNESSRNGKGANESCQPVAGSSSSSFKPTSAVRQGIENLGDRNCVNRKDEVEEKLSNCPSFSQENSNGKVVDNRKHQVQKDEETPESSNTLSLSIHGDSEYWEKFRYSKDYQSSLMIETICNQVFNLKPSPSPSRYKSLMKLSETDMVGISTAKDKTEKESPPQLPSLVDRSNDNDEKGIKVEILEAEKGTKGVKSILALRPHHHHREERKEKDGRRKVETTISFQEEQHQQHDDDDDDDGIIEEKKNDNEDDDNDDNGNEMEHERQWHEEKKRRNSITSSVFTARTATTSEDDEENYKKRRERTVLLDNIGKVFHGYLTKRETEKILRTEGQYLIRQMWNEDGFILSFMFDSQIRNYRLLYDIGLVEGESENAAALRDSKEEKNVSCTFYLEDHRKDYCSLYELVREGLITLHLDENAGSYIDLLVELAQFQQNSNLLQTPPAVTPGSRKTSRSASFRMMRLTSSSSATGSRGGTSISGGGGNGVDGDNSPSITDGRISMDIALRIHYFEEEIFDGLAKCQVCTNGIWGSSNKGMRCRDCGIPVHEYSCMDKVKSECKPDLTLLSPFSTDLTTLVKGSWRNSTNESNSPSPPYILRICINEVEARGGLTTEGIYRMCGSAEEIETLKNLFEKEKINTTFSQYPDIDIHSITGLIKFFLRQLPDSLITQDVFEEFVSENVSGEMKIDAVQTLVQCLPPAHRLTLHYLLTHLQRVSQERTLNKMNAFNLSSVFMPSVLGPVNMSFATLELGTKLLHFLISRAEQVFK